MNTVNSARRHRKLTQQTLAELADVSRSTVNGIETNRKEPSISVALALAQALDMPVDKLFRLE